MEQFKFHLHGFSQSRNPIYTTTVTVFKFHLHGFSLKMIKTKAELFQEFKFHLHGCSHTKDYKTVVDKNTFKFHLHGFSLVRFSVLIFQRFLY